MRWLVYPLWLPDASSSRAPSCSEMEELIVNILYTALDRPIGYLQVFYEYTVNNRLQPLNNRGQEYNRKLRRRFYSPYRPPKPRSPAWLSTQGIEFIVRKEFCRMVVLQVLQNDELRMHFRQRYVAYAWARMPRQLNLSRMCLPMSTRSWRGWS